MTYTNQEAIFNSEVIASLDAIGADTTRLEALKTLVLNPTQISPNEVTAIYTNASVDPSGTPQPSDLSLEKIYPVGAIYMSVVSTSPATLFGMGTWVAFGAGRTIVGLDSGQTEFDTVGETGGAKTHTLSSAEMPSHTHIQDSHNHTQNSHNHTQDSHQHGTTTDGGTTVANGAGNAFATVTASGATANVAVIASIAINQVTTATNQAATATNQNTGGGGAHNNLQPYVVVYMWKRIA